MPGPKSKAPRVFISYAHESDDFRQQVKELADWLTDEGIEVITDHPYEVRPPEEGWIAWMQHNIEDADVVLIVCSPLYKKRFEKREPKGKGATFEGAIITQELYDASLRNRKHFPILPDGGKESHIPKILRPFNNSHFFPSKRERILRLICEEVVIPMPARPFSPLPPGQLAGAEDNRLAPREEEVFGRKDEIDKVLAFLRSEEAGAAVCSQVVGAGGIGKTEVCKAALKAWLAESPDERAFYISMPDMAAPEELVFQVGRALGAENIARFEELESLLLPGLYYLDNLESVAEKAEGVKILRSLRQTNGMRILASSRVPLDGVLGTSIPVERLPKKAALRLFRSAWNGKGKLKETEELKKFVHEDLGDHALSVALTARLGSFYSFTSLLKKWKARGPALAKSGMDESRLGSLSISLGLTAQALPKGSHLLWTFSAVFPEGLPEDIANLLMKKAEIPDECLRALCRHHVWVLKNGHYQMLPPVGRYAVEEALAERGDFSWKEAREDLYDFFIGIAQPSLSIAFTDEAIEARGILMHLFPALHRFLMEEARSLEPYKEKLFQLHGLLTDSYGLSIILSQEILAKITPILPSKGMALLRAADMESLLENIGKARKLYNKAIALLEKEKDGPGIVSAKQSLGALESRLGYSDKARKLYNEAIALLEKEKGRLDLASAKNSLGYLEYHMGNLDKARELSNEAITLIAKEKDGLRFAYAKKSLGDFERHLGNIDEARKLYGEAIALFEKEKHRHGIEFTKSALDIMKNSLEDTDMAGTHPEESL